MHSSVSADFDALTVQARQHRTPVVLHHGLGGDFRVGPLRHRYFRNIGKRISQRYPLIESHVHPTAGIARRAQQLKDTILEQMATLDTRRKRVVIVAHSMGGLDARYMISRLGMDEKVAALVSITTPHRGSPYADWCLKHIGLRLGGLKLMEMLGVDFGALHDLTTEHCARFNDEVLDAPGVRYFSISASTPWHKIPAMALHAYRLIYGMEGPNDGLVSVQSASWSQHLCTWAADHFHTINHRLAVAFRRRAPDITPFYLRMLDQISAMNLTVE